MDAIKSVVAEPAILRPKSNRSSGAGNFGLKPGLRFKLLFLTITIVLLSLLLTAFLLLNMQRRQLIESAQDSASALNGLVEASLRHAMLSGDLNMVSDILQAVTADGAIQSVRILNDRGLVGFCSIPGEIGTRPDTVESAWQSWQTGKASGEQHGLLPGSRSDPAMLLTVSPLQNRTECRACHGTEKQVLGFLVSEMSMAVLEDQLAASSWRMLLSGVVAFGLLIGLLVPVLNRHVIRPVEALSQGVAEASVGNLDYPMQPVGGDELGTLATSFSAMQRQLKSTYAAMARKEQELTDLNEAALAVTQLLDLQEVLDFAMDIVVDRLGMEYGLIYLWDETEKRYRLRASRRLTAEQIEEIDRRRRSGWDIAGEVAQTGLEVIIADMSTDVRFHGVWDCLEERSFAELPLHSRGMIVGVIGMVTTIGRRIEPGDLDFLKSVGREIGIALDNALLLDATRQREREALSLYNLGTKISASLALPEVLDAVAEAARQLLEGDIGLVGVFDEASSRLVVQAAAGPGAEAFRDMRIPVWEGSTGAALVKGQTVMIDKLDPDHPPVIHGGERVEEEKIAALLAAPLRHGEHFLGAVEVLRRQPRRFVERDAQLLLRLAHQVVVSIENAQLYRQLRHLAVLDERGRLAREMHDRLAQALGYLNVKASITEDLLSSGRIEQAQESLSELKSVTKVVYTDLREAIFSLRTSVSSQGGLIPTLHQYLNEYQAHYGVEVQLAIRSDAEFDLSDVVAGQLLCIVQEALANIRKHSGASRVLVRYDQAGDQICLQIQDDGRGFDPARAIEAGGQHIGLQVMRERAESVGGRLEIVSEPGKGTQVTVRAPILFDG